MPRPHECSRRTCPALPPLDSRLGGAGSRLDLERHSGGIHPCDAGLGKRRAAQPGDLWTKRDDDDRSDDHRHTIDEERLLRSCLVLLGVITELERVPVFGFCAFRCTFLTQSRRCRYGNRNREVVQ
jgi:hypothetical protein